MEWYNRYMHQKMYEKFIKEHDETVDEVEKLLKSNNFEDFCLACNYIEALSYKGVDRLGGYDSVNKVRKLANRRVRDLIGIDAANLFDRIVKESKQELWGGDELYKLFSYDLPPYYVRRCIKSMLCVISTPMMCMTVDDCLKVANYIYYPPYWDIYYEDYSTDDFSRKEICKKECNAWHKIAKFLFEGKINEAYEFLKKENVRPL